jgi:hypothetical protein
MYVIKAAGGPDSLSSICGTLESPAALLISYIFQ